jgi:nitrate/nitrite transport system substrate-binding protein
MEDTVFTRRAVLRLAASTGVAATGAGVLAACGISDKQGSSGGSGKNQRKVQLGFMPASDAASVFMAKELGYFKERDLDVDVIRQASFAAMRDNLLTGKLDAAHALYSIPLAVAAKIAGSGSTEIKIAMVLSNNGQSLTLHKDLSAAGYADLAAARSVLDRAPVTLAMTFPGGTHDVFLRYWVKATKADATKVKIVTTPPPQMVANMKANNMAGFLAGEPWAYKGVHEATGFTHLLTQDLWADHPEKALIVGPTMKARQDVLADVMGAILKASEWLDKPANRAKAAQVAAGPAYVNMAASDLADRLEGHYDLGAGLGTRTDTEHPMVFYRSGAVAPLRRSHALWFLTQFQRVGLVAAAPDVQKIVDDVLLRDLFAKVADKEGLTVPDDDMAPIQIKLDGATFDPTKPADEVGRP